MVDRYYVILEGCHRAEAGKRVYGCGVDEGSIGITCMNTRPKEVRQGMLLQVIAEGYELDPKAKHEEAITTMTLTTTVRAQDEKESGSEVPEVANPIHGMQGVQCDSVLPVIDEGHTVRADPKKSPEVQQAEVVAPGEFAAVEMIEPGPKGVKEAAQGGLPQAIAGDPKLDPNVTQEA